MLSEWERYHAGCPSWGLWLTVEQDSYPSQVRQVDTRGPVMVNMWQSLQNSEVLSTKEWWKVHGGGFCAGWHPWASRITSWGWLLQPPLDGWGSVTGSAGVTRYSIDWHSATSPCSWCRCQQRLLVQCGAGFSGPPAGLSGLGSGDIVTLLFLCFIAGIVIVFKELSRSFK